MVVNGQTSSGDHITVRIPTWQVLAVTGGLVATLGSVIVSNALLGREVQALSNVVSPLQEMVTEVDRRSLNNATRIGFHHKEN